MFAMDRNGTTPISYRSAIEFSWLSALVFRGGMENKAAAFSGGFGLKLRRVQLDYAYTAHPSLKGSHALTITLALDPKHAR